MTLNASPPLFRSVTLSFQFRPDTAPSTMQFVQKVEDMPLAPPSQPTKDSITMQISSAQTPHMWFFCIFCVLSKHQAFA